MLYPSALVFIRGDGNVNQKNANRVVMFRHFLEHFSLSSVFIQHCTYHHFTGNGLYDSNIDVLLHSGDSVAMEQVVRIMCKLDYPTILSHHDVILSTFFLPAGAAVLSSGEIVTAPRLPNLRQKVQWTPEGVQNYQELIAPLLKQVRNTWLDPDCHAATSVLLQKTNFVLNTTASKTNRVVSLAARPAEQVAATPKSIQRATRKLNRAQRSWKATVHGQHSSSLAKLALTVARKEYRLAIRCERLQNNQACDLRLCTQQHSL